jgi:DNA-binding Lrp family transcriptional regulator
MNVDRIDLKILDALQDDLPLVSHPWQVIAERLGISETVMLERVKTLQDAGIIRGISPVLESRQMGLHAATLVAIHVPEERLDEIADVISSYEEVSHNFQRDHYYSLWFTIAAENEAGIRKVLDDMLQRTGIPVSDVLDLPTTKKIKINVRFSFLPAQKEECNLGPD